MKKLFILGIGSQRAGTTFLKNLLNQHQDIGIHPVKELHYFDTLFGLKDNLSLKKISGRSLEKIVEEVRKNNFSDFIWQSYVRTNYQLFTKPINSIDYKNLFLEEEYLKDIKFTGEITPEYMLLEESQILKIKETIGDAYIILICRNPIKRMISAFRLFLNGADTNVPIVKKDELFMEMLANNGTWIKQQIGFNDYSGAAAKYKKYFSKVLLLSYDDMVMNPEKTLESLSKFLNLEFDKKMLPFFDNKFNTLLNVKYSPSPEVLAILQEKFNQQLKEAESLLGADLNY
jgi:hypothetical protein